jgi:hypothetical protein
MDIWMDGWMGGWMDGWMDWMDGWMDGRVITVLHRHYANSTRLKQMQYVYIPYGQYALYCITTIIVWTCIFNNNNVSKHQRIVKYNKICRCPFPRSV